MSTLKVYCFTFLIVRTFVMLILCTLPLVSCTSPSQVAQPLDQETYARLDDVRERKEQQLIDYMAKSASSATAMGTDLEMIHLFKEKHDAYIQVRNKKMSLEAEQQLGKIRDAIEDRYIERYLMFHDILFIDPAGDIFYTVRRKADYHQNVFAGEMAETALSKSLQQSPDGGFVDFDKYRIAGEPSAFFVVPNRSQGVDAGWFVLQFSINKINEIFSIDETLGLTGEVFLVNRERAMLTDSRFFAQSTVLQKHLSMENITAKFNEKQGHKKVVDYRNFEALTSFKVVSVLGSEWLLIAKIDRDEVVTERYRRSSNETLQQLERVVMELPLHERIINHRGSRDIEVDMDEFRRVEQEGTEIYTHGVRTCTAVIFSYPGEFSYMAHISANDRIYGGDQTDLLGIIRKHIDDFDLVRAQKRYLQVSIISPIPQYRVNVVDSLADWGILLSQIKLVFNPDARHANISHDFESGKTVIEWELSDKRGAKETLISDYPALGALMSTQISKTDT